MNSLSPVVFVVDDDSAVRRDVGRLLRFAGFATATFALAREFLDKLPSDACGCVILELALRDTDGLKVQRALTTRGSVLPVIFLTGHGDIPSSTSAMKCGAVDFLTKPVSKDQLLDTVRQAVQRCEALRREHLEINDIKGRVAMLTSREREVLTHLLSGKLNKQIATDLGLAEKTIKAHRGWLMKKMQAPTVPALVRFARRAGVTAAAGESQ
jgi:FixJ family two-component response regulator